MDQEHREAADDSEAAPPDEHTRLLPNRVDSNRVLLTPDDPAVSPYNLWSIRVLRYLTLVLTAITFVWWVLLLVSAFATPPGLHTRGSGFLAFGLTTLTMANLGFVLIFFGVPSKAVRILAFVMAFLLLLDLILLLAVQQTRYEEGWVGIVSAVWALLMSLWNILTDRMVKWGKEEEEERLTGRAETRRTLTEWCAVIVSTIAFVVMVVAVVLITLTIILRALDASYAAPGKRYSVDGDKYRVHLFCHGNKTDSHGEELPTVLLEGGERPVEQGLWPFADNAIKNGSVSRYCFVDRPGMAWSDTAPSPLSAGFAVDVLSEALAKAGEQGPWVSVSAGIGSLYARVFSSRHGHDVRGLVFIDPLHEDLLGPWASPGRGFLLWLRGSLSPLGLDRLPGAIFRGRTSRDRVYGRAVQQGSKFIFAKLQESLVLESFTKRDVKSSRQIQERETPLVVISSGVEVKRSKEWERKQRDLTTVTDNLKEWDIVNGAGHEVWRTLEGREVIERRLKQIVRGK
ncbi:uncharacterized protein MAM_07679 [Metarhizium album ARSEF 1941]|uniref:Integral membrane protein n=1 Tax=Metarhizium album (strain ARSEF 1941) TaxID=1081103 RepID=A0A0B2WF21_METAS|nr:uncharacterized protein MAM_07679 [Metarhizium album ARSEF 1941]KHN94491.1 integral membrane protein [Metarhizium album ARSEF 1941]